MDHDPKTPPPQSEEAYLEGYREGRHPRPALTVDIVVLSILDNELKVLLIRRKAHPFRGRWALPGGFVSVGDAYDDQGEDLEQAARRELAEETGLAEGSVFLEQLYTFGDAYRDPRTRIITVAYYALVKPDLAPQVSAGSDAAEAEWHAVGDLPALELAFDHERILQVALERVRGKLDYSDIAYELVPDSFTIGELRSVHERIEGRKLDRGNFRRRFNRALEDGRIEQTTQLRPTSARPAKLYRFSGRR